MMYAHVYMHVIETFIRPSSWLQSRSKALCLAFHISTSCTSSAWKSGIIESKTNKHSTCMKYMSMARKMLYFALALREKLLSSDSDSESKSKNKETAVHVWRTCQSHANAVFCTSSAWKAHHSISYHTERQCVPSVRSNIHVCMFGRCVFCDVIPTSLHMHGSVQTFFSGGRTCVRVSLSGCNVVREHPFVMHAWYRVSQRNTALPHVFFVLDDNHNVKACIQCTIICGSVSRQLSRGHACHGWELRVEDHLFFLKLLDLIIGSGSISSKCAHSLAWFWKFYERGTSAPRGPSARNVPLCGNSLRESL